MIPYGRQSIAQEDVDAVVAALTSDWLTQGPTIPAFEDALAHYTGAAFAVAVNSATSGLHVAYLALGLTAGGRLWTSPNTFVATANCARQCGAEVDFVDIDPATWNMDVAALEDKLATADKAGTLPDIVVPVHFGGLPCDMARIRKLADRYSFSIVEDASHAVGARYLAAPVGGCAHSDITVFSFHPVKIMTTAEGGVALTNDPDLAEAMRQLRTHGVTRNPQLMTYPEEGPWYYEQHRLGLNYRMTDLHAALGLSQLNRLTEFVDRRRELARRYDRALAGLPVVPQRQTQDAWSAHHLYCVTLHAESSVRSRLEVFRHLRDAGIGVNVHYIPVHLQPYYRALGFRPGDFPRAEDYYARALTLPLFPDLSFEQQDEVVGHLRDALSA